LAERQFRPRRLVVVELDGAQAADDDASFMGQPRSRRANSVPRRRTAAFERKIGTMLQRLMSRRMRKQNPG
jgi:hypothetical protein